MKLPTRKLKLLTKRLIIPSGFEALQLNASFDTKEEAEKLNPFKIWKGIESQKYHVEILKKI